MLYVLGFPFSHAASGQEGCRPEPDPLGSLDTLAIVSFAYQFEQMREVGFVLDLQAIVTIAIATWEVAQVLVADEKA
jgi:hypothetical protein